MSRRGRSERTRPQRLARRQQDIRGFDVGGSRRSFYRQRWFKPIIGLGVLAILASLIGGGLLLTSGNNPRGNSDSSVGATAAPVRRIDDDGSVPGTVAGTGADLGAVDKPQFAAPPDLAIDPTLDYRAVLELETGAVQIDLLEDVAPQHVNNFVFLAEQGWFDGLTFHRVIANFVAQGGDPTATGLGGAGYVLPDESPAPDPRALTLADSGILAMARGGEGASSSQFFITLSQQGQLDGLGFTAFGRVTEGLDIVQLIQTRDPGTVPPPPPGARIVSIRIETGPRTAAASSEGATAE